MALAAAALLLAAAPQATTKIPPAEARALREALAEALDAARGAAWDPAAPAVTAALEPWLHAAERRAPEALFALLREGPLRRKPSEGRSVHEFEDHGWRLQYMADAPPAAGKGLQPVLLDPGVSTTSLRDAAADLLVLRAAADAAGWQDAILVRSGILSAAATRPASAVPDEETIARAFDALLRDLAARHPVDPDRVHLIGYAETATYAWHLGRALPGRWAGIFTAAGRAAWGQRAIGNLLPVPLFAAHGEKDPYFPAAETRAACAALEALGGRVRYFEIPGGDTGAAYAKVRDGLAWFAEQGPRRAFPALLDHRFSTLRNPQAAWIRAEALERENDGFGRSHPTARVQAAVDGQTIRLTVEGAPRLTLQLAPELLDLTQPLRVEWNGAVVFAGTVAPDLPGALRRFVRAADHRACGLAELTVAAPAR